MRVDAKMHTFPDRLLDERFRGTGAFVDDVLGPEDELAEAR